MRVLFVLAGAPPSRRLLLDEVRDSDLTVAVDGGLNLFRPEDPPPDLVIGDFDSMIQSNNRKVERVLLPDQNRTDFQKALFYVMKRFHMSDLILLGGSGGRMDHMIHNMQICASIDPHIRVTLKNNLSMNNEEYHEIIYRITPNSKPDLRVSVDTTLSIFGVTPFSGLTSKGLKWNLRNIDYHGEVISQSNKSEDIDPQFTLDSGCVYIAVYQLTT